MPNWCENTITLKIKNTNKVQEFLEKVQLEFYRENFNNYFIPRVDDFEENRENWGTKWEVSTYDFSSHSVDINEIKVFITFDTAWSPNIPVSKVFYNRLNEVGEVIEYLHEYSEDGCAFYGRFDGNVNDCQEINIMHYILNKSQSPLHLESNENNILKFENHDSLFIIKNFSEEKMNYYSDVYLVKVYECFSETFGENITIYEYDDSFYSFDIYL